MEGALTVAMAVVAANPAVHSGLSGELQREERVEGEALVGWLAGLAVPECLREFVMYGRLPDREALGLVAVAGPGLRLGNGGGSGGFAAAGPGGGAVGRVPALEGGLTV